MSQDKILYVVHCVDTEGPLDEDLNATFERLESLFGISLEATIENLSRIQNKTLYLSGKEEAIARCFSAQLLKYNRTWRDIELMLKKILNFNFRRKFLDDFNGGWIYSWHCMDHVGFDENPRRKDVGFGNIYRFYKQKLKEYESGMDELNWHFHPLSLSKYPTHAATSYTNSYDLLNQILARRIINEEWFPVVNRPGFHSERPDSHAFLEQWIPFDYANQSGADELGQPDALFGRFGDWARAPDTWRGYNPHHDDYQAVGDCRRKIFRCLNVGTRFRALTAEHVVEAFTEAQEENGAILAFANHDYRDIEPDVNTVIGYLKEIRPRFPRVKIKYSGAQMAARELAGLGSHPELKLSISVHDNRIMVDVVDGCIFGPQPFLAIKSKEGRYFHDNLDVLKPFKKWSYVLDHQTIFLKDIEKIGVGAAGRWGGYDVSIVNF